MSLPALQSEPRTGLQRSAALMRALGAQANAVWSTLTPAEAQQLTSAMDALPENAETETEAARAYVRDMSEAAPQAVARANFWNGLMPAQGAAIASAIGGESPQIIAVILSRLTPETAATAVRALPQSLATEALQRVMHLGSVRPAALAVIETALRAALQAGTTKTSHHGEEHVARIFDSLNTQSEHGLLAALDTAEPGAGERIRALMFTFDDLATLNPASIQTLLASTERAVLVTALKGAKATTSDALFKNMTSRAGELLRSEIEASGPIRRADIEAARMEIIGLARTLVKRGDILPDDANDEEFIE